VKRCSSTDSENMREKKLQKLIHAASKMFRDGGANEIFVNFPLYDSNTSHGL